MKYRSLFHWKKSIHLLIKLEDHQDQFVQILEKHIEKEDTQNIL